MLSLRPERTSGSDVHQPAVADVRIAGSRIVTVAPGLTPAPGETVIDAAGKLVIPGFVNAHYHSQDILAKGLLEEPFSYQGIGARKGEVYLVFADDTTSKPIPYAYRAVPVPGTDAPRIKRIDYAKQIPANGQMQPFRVEFEDNDADVAKIELIVRQGN